MKILFIQISDMHCRISDALRFLKIDKAVDAIRTLPKADKVVLVFSGDLVDTNSIDEYKVGEQMLDHLIEQLSSTLQCGFIPIYIVPGNHDMDLPEGCRDAATIEKWNLQEHLSEELNRIGRFFSCAASKNCFKSNKICDASIEKIGDVSIQICRLNSAPYSTREPDDKQFHFFPVETGENLKRGENVDFKITIMHHHFEWCEWSSKEMIKQSIASDDITFFGHDHKAEFYTTQYSDGLQNTIFMGGKFDLDPERNAAFNAAIFDNDQHMITRYRFDWATEARLFTAKEHGAFAQINHSLAPKEEYLEALGRDNQGISDSANSYFVFPKFTVEGGTFSASESIRELTEEDVFSALKDNRMIRITGGNGAGKTSLIKYLYNRSIARGYIPLLIENRDYRDSQIDKMFKNLFEEQYEDMTGYAYETYKQSDPAKKIVFVDNLDLIQNTRARENLVNAILEKNMMLIYTAKERLRDLEEVVKNKLEGKETCSLDIRPMYKENRDALVEKVGKILGKSGEEIDSVRLALDYMVQSQTGLFNFTPSDTLQYIKFFFREGTAEHKGFQSISLIFETNIRNAILGECSSETSNVYLSLLDFLADCMYFELKAEKVPDEIFAKIVEEFNSKRRTNIKPKMFLRTCVAANVLREASDAFEIEFHDKNTYAYFVAKSLSRQFEKSPADLEKLTYVMQHICFGINDTIILFLSFIRSNTRIITSIQKKAQELLNEFPEWNFEEKNIPFLQLGSHKTAGVPSSKERRNAKLQTERVEQERHNSISFRGIFDYDESDVQKERYVVLRALKYTELIGRGLADQYGNLDAEEVDALVSALYSLPQRIVYAVLKPHQDKSEEIVLSLLHFAKEKLPGEQITEEKIRQLFADAGTTLALNILNDIAFNSSNHSTIHALQSHPSVNQNDKIMCLMMQENVGNTAQFVQSAIALIKEIGGNPYARMLISRIAYKHIMYQENIDSREINRLISGKVLNEHARTSLLLGRGPDARA